MNIICWISAQKFLNNHITQLINRAKTLKFAIDCNEPSKLIKNYKRIILVVKLLMLILNHTAARGSRGET